MNIDFDPEKAFREIDTDHNGQITAYEIYRFMRDVISSRVTLAETELLIKEFDGDLDGKLSFHEFT